MLLYNYESINTNKALWPYGELKNKRSNAVDLHSLNWAKAKGKFETTFIAVISNYLKPRTIKKFSFVSQIGRPDSATDINVSVIKFSL